MRIRVRSKDTNINIPIPTRLIFSKGTAWLANHFGRKYAGDALKDIPPEAMEKIFGEFRRMKRLDRHWQLVEIDTADGEHIEITL